MKLWLHYFGNRQIHSHKVCCYQYTCIYLCDLETLISQQANLFRQKVSKRSALFSRQVIKLHKNVPIMVDICFWFLICYSYNIRGHIAKFRSVLVMCFSVHYFTYYLRLAYDDDLMMSAIKWYVIWDIVFSELMYNHNKDCLAEKTLS